MDGWMDGQVRWKNKRETGRPGGKEKRNAKRKKNNTNKQVRYDVMIDTI
jgi:hypothetical protein